MYFRTATLRGDNIRREVGPMTNHRHDHLVHIGKCDVIAETEHPCHRFCGGMQVNHSPTLKNCNLRIENLHIVTKVVRFAEVSKESELIRLIQGIREQRNKFNDLVRAGNRLVEVLARGFNLRVVKSA